MTRVAVVLGTRPEIVKLSPVLRAFERRSADVVVIHTGQHYSRDLDAVFFETLGLAEPALNLDVGSGTHAAQTARILDGLGKALPEVAPDVVLVQGDTNTVLAGALAAQKLAIRVGHVEAGLRSGDRTMPEEINRIVADHVSDLLFAPTEKARSALLSEGIPAVRIAVTGNTVVDAVEAHRAVARERSRMPGAHGLAPGRYAVLTSHRQENVDDVARFSGILDGARGVGETLGVPVVYPIHPRAMKRIERAGHSTEGLRLVPPLDFLDFLALESQARLVLTDSGGVQEECCILGVPCVTLRENTERPETIEVGANRLAGTDPRRIVAAARDADASGRAWANPFGDGRAGERIAERVLGPDSAPSGVSARRAAT